MKKGDILELEVIDAAFGGDGVCRGPEGVVFVPFAAKGDRLEVRVMHAGSRFSRGAIVRVIEPGPGRTDPPCKYYGTCGGCVYQHVDYPTELGYKQKQLLDALKRLGGFKELPTVSPVAISPIEYGYRNKLKLMAVPRRSKKGDVTTQFGYCAVNNRTHFAIDECLLASPEMNKELPGIIESAEAKDACIKDKPLTLRQAGNGPVHHYFKRASRKLDWIEETVRGKHISVPMDSFWQVNKAVADQLFATISKWFDENPTDVLVDAYAGTGPFSLAMEHPEIRRVLIEMDDQAMKAAEINHKQLGLKRVDVIPGRTESKLPRVLKQHGKSATVIIDPPRTGCDPSVLKCLLDSDVQRVIYVSCNPSTLARDLKLLCADGAFSLEKLAQFDMFPRTAHFETAALLVRSPA